MEGSSLPYFKSWKDCVCAAPALVLSLQAQVDMSLSPPCWHHGPPSSLAAGASQSATKPRSNLGSKAPRRLMRSDTLPSKAVACVVVFVIWDFPTRTNYRRPTQGHGIGILPNSGCAKPGIDFLGQRSSRICLCYLTIGLMAWLLYSLTP